MVAIEKILSEMIEYSEGNIHDVNHFLKVWGLAQTVGKLEGLDEKTQYILETAAIVHDIACPLCREKYGDTYGELQEKEGGALTEEFLSKCGVEPDIIERVSYLVSHHHTYDLVDGPDYQILLEADFLVNANEEMSSEDTIRAMRKNIFKTESGKNLLDHMYSLH